MKYALCYLCATGIISALIVMVSYGFFGVVRFDKFFKLISHKLNIFILGGYSSKDNELWINRYC